jgi:hypothetical protein
MSIRKQHSSLLTDTSSLNEDEGIKSQEIASSPQTPLRKPSKKRRADGSLAGRTQDEAQIQASWAMDGLQRSLPSTPAATTNDGAKEAIEEQRLRRAIEEAERRTPGLEPAGSDLRTGKGMDQATESENEKQTQKGEDAHVGKGRRHRRASSFLEWKEPVLR